MREINASGKTIILDDEGFLMDEDKWDRDVAKAIATHLDLPHLDEEQISIIEFLREYYRKFNAFPILNYVCKYTRQPHGCVNNKFVDPMKAWKIAGLPKLDGIHFVSFDGKNYRLEECC